MFNNTPKMTIDTNGKKYWRLHGQYHREDGPAVEQSDGHKEWWIRGVLHRENGPAIECANGDREWYIYGQLHREDGPAVEYADGHKEWWINGRLHREDGPAIEYNTKNLWYIYGYLIKIEDVLNKLSVPDFIPKPWMVNYLKYYGYLK